MQHLLCYWAAHSKLCWPHQLLVSFSFCPFVSRTQASKLTVRSPSFRSVACSSAQEPPCPVRLHGYGAPLVGQRLGDAVHAQHLQEERVRPPPAAPPAQADAGTAHAHTHTPPPEEVTQKTYYTDVITVFLFCDVIPVYFFVKIYEGRIVICTGCIDMGLAVPIDCFGRVRLAVPTGPLF